MGLKVVLLILLASRTALSYLEKSIPKFPFLLRNQYLVPYWSEAVYWARMAGQSLNEAESTFGFKTPEFDSMIDAAGKHVLFLIDHFALNRSDLALDQSVGYLVFFIAVNCQYVVCFINKLSLYEALHPRYCRTS